MRFAQASSPSEDHVAEKEAKLKAFISEYLTGHAGSCNISLVVRSAESPISRSLASALSDLRPADYSIQIIVFEADGGSGSTALEFANAEFRVLQDSRFGVAHEQLVIGDGRVWVGDCMRRDPAKRDAFEMYYNHNELVARSASTSFARLWQSAVPLYSSTADLGTGVLALRPNSHERETHRSSSN